MTRDARRGQNEAWFRELNERLEERSLDEPSAETSFEIVCECALEECAERIVIDFGEYEEVRAHPTRFILVRGHRDPSIERMVARTRTYEVVEKIGVAAVVAEEEVPRS